MQSITRSQMSRCATILTAVVSTTVQAQVVSYPFTGTRTSGSAGNTISGTITLDVGAAPSNTIPGDGTANWLSVSGFSINATTDSGVSAGTSFGGDTRYTQVDRPGYLSNGIFAYFNDGVTIRAIFLNTYESTTGDGIFADVDNPWDPFALANRDLYIEIYDIATATSQSGSFSLDTFGPPPPFDITTPPAGSTFTTGDPVTIEWTGGAPSWLVTLYLIEVTPGLPFAVAASVASGVPNSGSYTWNFPDSHPFGDPCEHQYQFYVEDSDRTSWIYGPVFTVVCPNSPPTAVCSVQELLDIGDQGYASFSAAGSSDPDGDPLTFSWTLTSPGSPDITSSDEEFTAFLDYGDWTVTLDVSDGIATTTSEPGDCDLTVDPALLSLFDCEKVEVEFCLGDADSDPSDDDSSADDASSGCTSDRVKIKGEIGLPMGVDFTELDAFAMVDLAAGDPDFINVVMDPITFEVHGGDGHHWKYRNDSAGPGVTKLDIDWKGARFKYDESGFPVEFESEFIGSDQTILEMEFKEGDIDGNFSVDIAGGAATVDLDDDGNVLASSGLTVEVKKTGKKLLLTLPFPLREADTIALSGAPEVDGASILVSDHYTNSLGRFKLEAESGMMLEAGANALPRGVDLHIGVGTPLYPGWCTATEDELKVHSRKWKAKN
ncbi:MAG: hypothetical protein HKO59_06950 [Phycisphaerales bacterium]|nr:hypothetical protein [Phycisphaerae bacterium]NNM25713.1 hypothetical protein [Phycisphaerales bacterium]